jgi:hypothetical protein
MSEKHAQFYRLLQEKYGDREKHDILGFKVRLVTKHANGSARFDVYDPNVTTKTGKAKKIGQCTIAPELMVGSLNSKTFTTVPDPDKAIWWKLGEVADRLGESKSQETRMLGALYSGQLYTHPDYNRIMESSSSAAAAATSSAPAASSSSAAASSSSPVPPSVSPIFQPRTGDESAVPSGQPSGMDDDTAIEVADAFDKVSVSTVPADAREVSFDAALPVKLADMVKIMAHTGRAVADQYRGLRGDILKTGEESARWLQEVAETVDDSTRKQVMSIDDMKHELGQLMYGMNGAIATSTGEQVINTAELQQLILNGNSAMKLETLKNEPLTLIGTILGLDEQGDFTEADKLEISDKASALTKVDFRQIRGDAEEELRRHELAHGYIGDPRQRNGFLNHIMSIKLQEVADKTRGEIRDMAKTVLQKRGAKIFTPKTQSLKSKRKMLEKIKIK